MSDPEQVQPQSVHHKVERHYTVAASPEQVWEAIATGQGISAWMVPTELEERVGGAVAFDVGDMVSHGVVTDYTPHERFAYEEPWPVADRVEDVDPGMARWLESMGITPAEVVEGLASVTPIATEFVVEAESGGSCVIHVVTSAYGSGASWEHEFFTQMAAGFVPMLDQLPVHLGTVASR